MISGPGVNTIEGGQGADILIGNESSSNKFRHVGCHIPKPSNNHLELHSPHDDLLLEAVSFPTSRGQVGIDIVYTCGSTSYTVSQSKKDKVHAGEDEPSCA